MPAYIIVEIDVKDPAVYEDYKVLAPPSIEQYGGRYIVRGGKTETLEGNWVPKRIVVLEFPDFRYRARVGEFAGVRRGESAAAELCGDADYRGGGTLAPTAQTLSLAHPRAERQEKQRAEMPGVSAVDLRTHAFCF